jgi:hypothetical protein
MAGKQRSFHHHVREVIMAAYLKPDKKEDKKGAAVAAMLGLFGLAFLFLKKGPPKPPPPGKASLGGQVIDTLSRLPIQGVIVNVGGVNLTTNAEGAYSISNLDPGTYIVTCGHPDYEAMVSEVTLAEGENILDIALTPKAIISGIVTNNETLAVLPGVVVALDNLTATTNGNGVYAITRLTPGPYTITVNLADFEPFSLPVNLVPGMNEVDISLTPTHLATLKGVIRDNLTNEPVAGVTISVDGLQGASGPDGSYSVAGIEIGPHLVTMSHPWYEIAEFPVTLVEGENVLSVFLNPINYVFDGDRHTPGVSSLLPERLMPEEYLLSVQNRYLTGYASIKIGDDIYCFGGHSTSSQQPPYASNHAWKYNIPARSWSRLANLPNANWLVMTRNAIGVRNGQVWCHFSRAQYSTYCGVQVFDLASGAWVYQIQSADYLNVNSAALPCDYGFYANYFSSGNHWRRLDYATLAWSPDLPPPPFSSLTAAKIGGLFYMLGDNGAVYRWDELNDLWRDMLQNFPTTPQMAFLSVDENEEAMYAKDNAGKVYRYTPEIGWTYYCTLPTNLPFHRLLVGPDLTGWLTTGFASSLTDIRTAAIYRVLPDRVDALGTKMLDIGDELTLEIPAGAVIYIEKDGAPWEEVRGNAVIPITQTAYYRFTMDSEFPHEEVKISWRHP